MPMRITVEKHWPAGNLYWSNVYYSNAADPVAAVPDAGAAVAAERPLYPSWITITKARIDDNVPMSDVSHTLIYNLGGLRAGQSGDPMPAWVVARVDFQVGLSGRPSRKYLRFVLHEGDTSATELNPAMLAMLQTYANAIIDAPGIVDVDGQIFNGGAPFRGPAMRQVRRGSKKKVIP